MIRTFALRAMMLLAALGCVNANATIYAWSFESTVRMLSDNADYLANSNIDVGTQVSGQFIVDDSAPGTQSGNNFFYEGGVVGSTFHLGLLTVDFAANDDQVNHVALHNGTVGDAMSISSGLSNSAFTAGTAFLQLVDLDGDMISGAGFPSLPSLGNITPYDSLSSLTTGFFFSALVDGTLVSFGGEVTSMEARVVPLPGGVWLLASALFGLYAGRRKR